MATEQAKQLVLKVSDVAAEEREALKHPTVKELETYARNAPTAAEVIEHVSRCHRCQRQVRSVQKMIANGSYHEDVHYE